MDLGLNNKIAFVAASSQGLGKSVALELANDRAQSLRSVINATGVILQTNLGRAPLSQAAIRRIEEVASANQRQPVNHR